MPEYTYRCAAGHEQAVMHAMFDAPVVVCACGLAMWRKPQAVYINWNGLRPSVGSVSPAVQQLIDTAPQRRDEFERVHEEHEKRTASEARAASAAAGAGGI